MGIARWAYLKAEKAQYAERSFEHALELDARTRDAHAYLGEVALQRGDLGKAEREFQAELLIDANQSFALGGDG
jgi:Tfp pilus assembly protein PilF